jgi:sn-glycerol 3-phosphate transport system substrate-binding protein
VLAEAPQAQKQAAWEFIRFMLEPEQVIEWSRSTGYLPVTRSAVAELERRGFYRDHPNYRVAYNQLRVASPWPWSTELFRIQREILGPLIERAVLSGASAAGLINTARRQLQSDTRLQPPSTG